MLIFYCISKCNGNGFFQQLSAHSSRAQSDAEELPSQHNQSEAEELSPPHNKTQAESEESDFSSVGDDVPANVDDSWSSDSTESDMEEAAAGRKDC